MENNTSVVKDDSLHLYKCWAAIRDNQVISVISMNVPNDVDFDKFRESALSTLSKLGSVKAGDVYLKDSKRYFLARPNKHQNRSKKKPIEPILPIVIQEYVC